MKQVNTANEALGKIDIETSDNHSRNCRPPLIYAFYLSRAWASDEYGRYRTMGHEINICSLYKL